MNLICRIYEKWLLPYDAGTLSECDPDRAAGVARHLESCASCRRRLEDLREFDKALRRQAGGGAASPALSQGSWIERSRASSEVVRRVLSRIEPEDRFLPNSRWAPGVASFAGIAIVAVGLIAIADPQSAAREWIATTFLTPREVAAPAHVVAPAPFPAANDPFKAPIAPRLLETTKPDASPVIPSAPPASIVRLASPRPTSLPERAVAPPPVSRGAEPSLASVAASRQTPPPQPSPQSQPSSPGPLAPILPPAIPSNAEFQSGNSSPDASAQPSSISVTPVGGSEASRDRGGDREPGNANGQLAPPDPPDAKVATHQ
ncbi:MAG: hypothetical protein P4L33_20705 [Capsulimonadaceae bacterium]|nr:hypothetical protein [Capsulimonadaceae bacterium]